MAALRHLLALTGEAAEPDPDPSLAEALHQLSIWSRPPSAGNARPLVHLKRRRAPGISFRRWASTQAYRRQGQCVRCFVPPCPRVV